MSTLREITEPVDLCDSQGRLNPAAIGWSRRPLHTANIRGRGRAKRWEYWAISSPRQVLGITVSDLDYASLYAVYFLAPDGSETVISRLAPLARTPLPPASGAGSVSVHAKDLAIDLVPGERGLRLQVTSSQLIADVTIERPPGHESLGVVVPWSSSRFQYTVKENTLPARGQVIVGRDMHPFDDDSWATLDHGRGRWPYRVTWNWGSGSGIVDGRTIGIQVGGKWTDGTGSTENALCLDGRIHYIGEELVWEYDADDWMREWRVHTPSSDRVDLRFAPLHVRTDRINLGVLFNDTHQAFGTWSGAIRADDGELVRVDGVRGWAEEVVNRW